MDSLSPANQALIAKMQNNQAQVQTQTQTPKAPELPTDSVELSTSVKKPKNKAAMIIGGLVAGAAVAASLIVAYKKGVFFKLEGAMLKKEADKAYQKAQVMVEEVAELINKGLNEGLEEFTDEKTGRMVKMSCSQIEEYDGDSLVRRALFSSTDGEINISQIGLFKKGKMHSNIDLSENKITGIGKGITLDDEGMPAKFSRIFNYEQSALMKNINADCTQGKYFHYDNNGKLNDYGKQTKTHSTEWSQEDGLKREKLIKPEVDIEPEEEPINIDDIIITASEEDFAE